MQAQGPNVVWESKKGCIIVWMDSGQNCATDQKTVLFSSFEYHFLVLTFPHIFPKFWLLLGCLAPGAPHSTSEELAFCSFLLQYNVIAYVLSSEEHAKILKRILKKKFKNNNNGLEAKSEFSNQKHWTCSHSPN